MSIGSRFRARNYGPLLLTITSLALLLFGPVGGSTMDDEEYRNVVVSLVLHARALLDGYYPFWTSDLGLGLPHPLHPTFFFHPLMPLFGAVSPAAGVRLLNVAHALVGVAGAWRLMRHVGGGPWVASVSASTWLLANPALNYTLTDLWLANFYGWALYPWLLHCLLRVLDHPGGQPWRVSLQLGLAAGLLAVGGHMGHIPTLVLPLAVMCLSQPRRTARRLPALIAAAVVGTVIAAPVVVRLVQELPLFADVPRDTVAVSNDARAALDLVLRPLLDFQNGRLELGERGVMHPFFGGPMFLLALAYIAGVRRPGPVHAGMIVAFVVSGVVLFWPDLLDRQLTSGTYMYRDALTLFGIVLGGLALEELVRRSVRTAFTIGAAQLAVLAVCAWPFASAAWSSSGIERRALDQTPITSSLRDWAGRLSGRWYLAPQLDQLVGRGSLADDGLWRDIWVYRGLPVVNGSFKGVSADVLYPSGSLPIGRIAGEPATVQSADTLSVLGIGAVVAADDEPVAPQLEEVARFAAEGHTIRLLRNPSVWARGALLPEAAVSMRLPQLTECQNAGLFCRDFSAVAATEHDARVRLSRRHGTLEAQFAAAPAARVLVLPEMFRPEWTARSGDQRLSVVSAWGGLVAVRVPGGVSQVQLRYRPVLVMALTALSALTTVAVGLTLFWQTARARARA